MLFATICNTKNAQLKHDASAALHQLSTRDPDIFSLGVECERRKARPQVLFIQQPAGFLGLLLSLLCLLRLPWMEGGQMPAAKPKASAGRNSRPVRGLWSSFCLVLEELKVVPHALATSELEGRMFKS